MYMPAQVTTASFTGTPKAPRRTEDSDWTGYNNLGDNDQPANYAFTTGPEPLKIHAQGGDDIISLRGNGLSFVQLGSGNDSLFGAEGRDNVDGDSGNDLIHGNGGNDYLDGGAGNDFLLGGTGDDHLLGGAGNDRLYGGAGSDRMTGGTGMDTFFFDREQYGVDYIRDFEHGIDKIDLRALSYYAGQYPGSFIDLPEIHMEETPHGTHVEVTFNGPNASRAFQIYVVSDEPITLDDFLL